MTDPPVELPIRTLTDESDAPKHQQLREILEDVCINYLNPGDMLPGERVLEEQYGVSRITVRRAIGDLVASGKLRRARGKGTFVAHSPLVARVHLASFSDEMAAQNITSSSKILLSAWTTAPEEIRIFFNSPLTKPHTHLRRLRLGNGKPFSIDDGWYNSLFAPDLLENDVYKSVYAILDAQYHVPITDAEQIVSAIAAGSDDSEFLQVDKGTPLLKVVRFSRSNLKPIEWCSSLYRTDRYALHTLITKA
ncbi:MAG: GntR family transcriptional regulator [Corynebacterium matruchotii]|jgi:ubiC transcription regulator-associated domain protein|uniref:UbiC transcription regulator-associated domain protein n=3 Tax=Corynebacterium matruchotii TaxID=43768 RepID=E0DEB7_9CORY|nr:GntR family transcriptional regulator [Corynebacterium matruchotii]RKW23068.1 MAG: GntR family transcriptional regulator [Corynebacterium sp.]EEG26077.1 UbiC transcription regulator-associated domain protein [Corynebacterium matruchotii ATCC 33806]EFM49267.1 UbiC transcription regulator-associated domain protein [Corynebacterium matruchotii ATCC 14266]KAB1925897.1 GntR family transcriptional regulator [Corynebacterium matruchotii]QIP45120.1 GntR family transcriptional regulator [Corynebacte